MYPCFSQEYIIINPQETTLIPTGIALEVPVEHVAADQALHPRLDEGHALSGLDVLTVDDDERLAVNGLVDETRELCLCFVDVHGTHPGDSWRELDHVSLVQNRT